MHDDSRLDRSIPPPGLDGRWLIVWDGTCGFCRRAVEWALAHDRSGLLTAAPWQACAAWLPEAVRAAAPQRVHLRAPDGHYTSGGAACVQVLRLCGNRRTAALLDAWPCRPMVEAAYRWVARHRSAAGRWLFRGGA